MLATTSCCNAEQSVFLLTLNLFVCGQLYEGLKVYRGVDGVMRIFRPDLNMERMVATARRVTLPYVSLA